MIDYFDDKSFSKCALKWRMGHLLVKPISEIEQVNLPAVGDQEWLVECLKCSSVHLVSIDPKLGEKEIKFWADACQQAGKPIYVRVKANQKRLPRPFNWFFVGCKYFINLIFAFLLILLLSPVMAILACFIAFKSPNQIFFHEWRIGKRGKLFRTIKFNTKAIKVSDLPNHESSQELNTKFTFDWMLYYLLDYLPQLFNVLRGDMALNETVYYRFLKLLMTNIKKQQQLNKLPHIVKDCLINEVKTQQMNLDILK